MNRSEYDEKMLSISRERDDILKEFDHREKVLAREFAFSNNNVEVGDIVTNHTGESIEVQKVLFARRSYEDDVPCCVYEGVALTKKMKPRVDGTKLKFYQTRVTNITKKETA